MLIKPKKIKKYTYYYQKLRDEKLAACKYILATNTGLHLRKKYSGVNPSTFSLQTLLKITQILQKKNSSPHPQISENENYM